MKTFTILYFIIPGIMKRTEKSGFTRNSVQKDFVKETLIANKNIIRIINNKDLINKN